MKICSILMKIKICCMLCTLLQFNQYDRDKLLISKIPIVKSFAGGMRSFIEGLKKDAGIKLNESSYNLNENLDFDEIYNDYGPIVFKTVCLKYANGDDDKE